MHRAERRASGLGLLDRSSNALTSAQLLEIRHIRISETRNDYFNVLRGAMRTQLNGESQAFVFVHGYNVSFEEAMKRTAQIAFDLDFGGAGLLFTWPSRKRLLSYNYDRDSADIAVNHLIEFLDIVAKEMSQTRLHFVVHSMGNIVLLAALEKIALRSGGLSGIKLGEIILAHPDVDQDRFGQLVGAVKPLDARMTLYTSQSDWATWVSRMIGGAERAGGQRLIAPGMETIDISGLGTRLLSANHNVYSSNPLLFGDISRLIREGVRPPDKRTASFEPIRSPEGVYWRYRPEVTGP